MSLLDDVSIVVTPNGYKAGELYAVIPSDGAADMDFTRATAATRVDENGLIADVLANVPRIDYTGGGCPHILAEPQRTNIVFPSDVAVTQTRTVTAVAYALSFYGTGSIVLSGTHSATLTGTGVNDRVDLIFTPTAGSLVLTASGTVTNFQLEVGSYATSYIPTLGSTVTRNQDIFTRDGIGSLINSTEGTFFLEPAYLSSNTNYDVQSSIVLSDGSANNRVILYTSSSASANVYSVLIKSGGSTVIQKEITVTDITLFNKIAITWKANEYKIFLNGSPEYSTIIPTATPIGLNSLFFAAYNSTVNPFYGKVKQLQVYTTALSDVQLAALTS